MSKSISCIKIPDIFLSFKGKLFFLVFILVYCLAFLYRLLFWQLDPLLSRDSCLYISLIQEWFESGTQQVSEDFILQYGRIPAFPLWFMKIGMFLGFSAESSARFVNIAAGSAIPLWGYGISYILNSSRKLAAFVALLLVVHPVLLEYSVQPQRDSIYLFFVGGALWGGLYGMKHDKYGYVILSGAMTGFAILCRYEACELLILIPVFMLMFQTSLKKMTWFKFYTIIFSYVVVSVGLYWVIISLLGNNNNTSLIFIGYFKKILSLS